MYLKKPTLHSLKSMHLTTTSTSPHGVFLLASHLPVSSQLHSLEPDDHLLGTDASRRVPLTPSSLQLDIPNKHKTFSALNVLAHTVLWLPAFLSPCSGLPPPSPPRTEKGPVSTCTLRLV